MATRSILRCGASWPSTASAARARTARQLIPTDYDRFDLLVGMDRAKLRNMRRICGGDFAGKLHLLMDCTDRSDDITDPWCTDDFETTGRDVLAGCQGLLRLLRTEEDK